MHPDEGFSNFNKIYAQYNNRMEMFSECDTRCKVIDSILIECLGYDKDCIVREPHVQSGFIDYKIEYNGIPMLVIEAKKAGDYFNIPISYNSRSYKINGVISTIQNLMSAINQARNYCDDIGCKHAVVFNGHQLVIFSAITIGKPWKEGYCYMFNSLDDIKKNFYQFWNILSYDSVKNGSLIKLLDKGTRNLKFRKVLTELHNKDECLVRNELYTYIQPISEQIFSELLDEKRTETLRECYIYGRSNSPLTKELEDCFIDKLPNYFKNYKVKEVIENKKKSGNFQQEYSIKSYDKSEGYLMVLLGGVGSGKSTFLHRFFKIVLSDKENLIWFYIDFRKSPYDVKKIEEFIYQKIFEEWENKYKGNLIEILEKNAFNIDTSDLKKYLNSLFKLLRECKFSITLVIDNVDQHDRIFQEKLFILSSYITDFLKIVTIVALREESFLISSKIGVFDAYDIPKFHIASPNFLNMIIKRIEYTIKSLNMNMFKDIPLEDRNNLVKYFSIIKSSLESKNSQAKQLVSFIDSVSVGNMRYALKMFNNFIKSGNINIKEIFEKNELAVSGGYQISYHQFLKAIILGEYRFYSQDRSDNIINIFDFDMSLTDSPFNLLRILNFLELRNNKQTNIGRGYVLIDDINTAAQSVSIRKEVICDSLLRLAKYYLVEFNNQSQTDIQNASYVKITHAGKYYLEDLTKTFIYLDLILVDTPICDEKIYRKLKNLASTTELSNRLIRTELFISHLINQEEDEFKYHPEYLSNEFTNKFYAKSIYDKFEEDKAEIQNKLHNHVKNSF